MRGIQYSLDIDKYRSFQTEKISLSLIEIFFVSSVYNFSFSSILFRPFFSATVFAKLFQQDPFGR